jgi:hypothetical protein
MNTIFRDFILEKLNATDIFEIEKIQSLWSGYGGIIRYGLVDAHVNTIVVKHVKVPVYKKHPRGWNTNLSHKRKLKSYQVESAWYKEYASQTFANCRIPTCYGIETVGDEICMLLEDLDAIGFELRKSEISAIELENCIKWLANFHARYIYEKPNNLWNIGTYWHLDTRLDELEVLEDIELKNSASKIDKLLNESPFQTFVHGDAKLANFCFSKNGAVAAVDFQYVGGGIGVKDLAYFVGSCFYEDACETKEEAILSSYFTALKKALEQRNTEIDVNALEQNWRSLYPVAWTDFHRFLKGWNPGHWKINSYSERICKEVLKKINA